MLLFDRVGVVVGANGNEIDFDIPQGCWPLSMSVFAGSVNGASTITAVFELKDKWGHYNATFAASGGQILSASQTGILVNPVAGYNYMPKGRVRWIVTGTGGVVDIHVEGQFQK